MQSLAYKFHLLDSCNNDVCDASIGENCASCYQDCGICTVSTVAFESLYQFANSSSTIVVYWAPLPEVEINYTYVLQISKNESSGFSHVYPRA